MANYPLSGTCTEDGEGVEVTFAKGAIKVKATASCTSSGKWSVTKEITGFGTGSVTITASHEKDVKGTTFSATSATQSVNRLPYVTISASDITAGNDGTFTVSGTCSESDQNVSVTVSGTGTGSGSETKSDISCDSGKWTWDVSLGSDRTKFPTGAVTITADQSSSSSLNAPQESATVNRKPIVTIDMTAVGEITEAKASTYAISGTCTESGQPVTVTVTQGIDSANPSPQPTCGSATTGEWSTTVNVSSLGIGYVNIEVAHNNGGSLAASPASEDVKKLPHVSIKTPLPKVTGGNKGNYPLSGDCSEDGVNVVLTVTGITSVPVVFCGANSQSGQWSATVNLGSAEVGAIDITADHKKTIGDVDFTAPTASASISKLPVVTIVTAPSINAGNAETYTLSGTCTESGQPVTVSVGSKRPDPQPTCSGDGDWEVTSLDVSSLATGEVTITADHSTTGGDSSLKADQASTKVDKVPSVTVASDTSIINDETSINLSGKCSEAEQSVTIKLVGEGKSESDALTSSRITCAVSGNTWAWFNVDISDRVKFPTGTLTITADHSVKGSSPVKTYIAPSKSIEVKRNPVVKITSAPHITNGNMADYPLSGTCTEDGENVEVIFEKGATTVKVTVSCTSSGEWSVTKDITGFGTGSVTITASHEKTITNDDDLETFSATSATQSVNRLPYVTISASDITAGNDGTFTVSGTCSESDQNVSVTVSGTGTGSGSETKSNISCDSGKWTWDVSLGSDRTKFPTGAVTITADQSSSGGLNAPPKSTGVDRKPIVTIDMTAVGEITEAEASTYAISGTCTESGQPVDRHGDPGKR